MILNVSIDTASKAFRNTLISLAVILLPVLAVSTIYAWTGPTQTPPNGNVAAPINVSSTSQIKDGALSVNGLSVYGNQYISGRLGVGVGANSIWAIDARGQYGVYGEASNGQAIRGYAPNGGSYAGYFVGYGGVYSQNMAGYYTYLNYPGSSWSVYSYGNTYASGYARADGGFCIGGSCKSSWAPSQTYVSASCSAGSSGGFCTATTANCPSGYVRSGCSGSGASGPYSSNACQCTGAPSASCVTYCVQ